MQFSIAEGRNLNLFFQDELSNAHVLWRHEGPQRLYFCFPEGNSGVGVDLSGPMDLSTELASWGKLGALRGVEVVAAVTGNLTVGEACLDSLRTLRDRNHPEAAEQRRLIRERAGLPQPEWRAVNFAGGSAWELRARGLAGRWNYLLRLETSAPVTWEPLPTGGVLRGPTSEWILRIRAGHDHPPLVPLGENRLLSRAAEKHFQAQPKEALRRVASAQRNLAFLTFETKVVAGSWRFLTYFGRDTLLTSLLLGQTASFVFHLAALNSVLARLSPGGQVAHEEDIGEQAAYRRWQISWAGQDPAQAGEPVYDYKMVDDDFLLLVALKAVAHHHDAPQGWWESWLQGHQAAIETNIQWCLGRLGALVGLDHQFIGDWRDSHWGLGGGLYPNSVNIGLVPAFCEALAWYRGGSKDEDVHPEFWAQVPQRFQVRLSAMQIRSRLAAYLGTVPLHTEEGQWLRNRVLAPGVTVGEWVQGRGSVEALEEGLVFSCLALDQSGEPIEVIHSDLSFRLFLAQPDQEELSDLLTLLELPYPLGLAHPVGFLVANACLSGRPDLWEKLNRQGYHGAVVWSWQDAMIALGLTRQSQRTDLDHPTQERIRLLRAQAREQRECAAAFSSSELWTWKVVDSRALPQAFGAEAGDETESNAIQLWSSAALALAHEELGEGSAYQ